MKSLTENNTGFGRNLEKEAGEIAEFLTRKRPTAKLSEAELRNELLKFAAEFQMLLDLRRYVMQQF